MAEEKYQRLTRARARTQFAVAFMARSSLWLGSDHLLLVEFNGYAETYKRFYFRDIQAITVCPTSGRAIWNWVLGSIAALCLVFSTFKSNPVEGKIALLIIAFVVCGIPLLFNNLFGSTCACQLRTAVQTESLPSLHRMRQVRKILNRIRPLIVAAQGQLTTEEVSAQMQSAAMAARVTPPPPPGVRPPILS